jgi:hypothetical protein
MHDRSRAAFFVASVALLSVAAFAIWRITYPDPWDPKNIYYVLWKHGLDKKVNLDYALGAMTGDASRDKLVLGFSEAQLTSRFGYVKQMKEVAPYYQRCFTDYSGYRGGATAGEKAIFLRNSWWMVVLKGDVASDLVLCKGY